MSAIAEINGKRAAPVTVTGDGILAATVRAALHDLPSPAAAQEVTLQVSVADSWTRPAGPATVRRVTVHAELGSVIIGPMEVPGEAGCGECVDWRRRQAEASTAFAGLRQRHRRELETRPSAWLTGLGAGTVAALVADEYSRLLRGEAPRTDGAVMVVDLADLTISRHRFLPDPRCPACGNLPEDAAGPIPVGAPAQPKLAPDTHRTRQILDDIEMLEETYVDPVCGIVRGVFRRTMGGVVVATAPLRLPDGREENGFGRTLSYRRAELVAILEALERLGGARPGGKATAVEGSLSELAGQALDPRTVGVHPAASYDTPGFAFRRFTPHEICRWVWGHSLTRASPILVPETLAYYRLPQHRPESRGFVYELSNGCALGSSPEEATLHGLLEVVERDAFLMTWYARLPPPRIDLEATSDPRIRLTAAAIRAQTGYDLQVFDTTMEHGIPSTWALAVNPRDEWPKMTCAAGSSFDPEQSILNALNEIGPIVEGLKNRDPGEADRTRRMLGEPAQVVTMDDHTALYAHPEAFGRLDFLTRPTGASAPALADPAFRHADLIDDLQAAVARLSDAGMEVIAVDQTTSEHRAANLWCVKVLVPGALPMTFGHLNRRTEGLPRLLDVPRMKGGPNRPLTGTDLNPHPHPFP